MPESAKRYRARLAQQIYVRSGVLAAITESKRLPIAREHEAARKALIRELETIYRQAMALRQRANKAAQALGGLPLNQTWMPDRARRGGE
jgi:hypothetical protein